MANGWGDFLVVALSITLVTLFAICCLLLLYTCFLYHFMPYSEYIDNPIRIIPARFDFKAYELMLGFKLIRSGYLVTLFVTIVGTLLSVFLLVISAYPLSKNKLKGHRLFMSMIMFTMFFNGGMIPNYLLIRNLQLYNSVWALIIPGSISAFNLILMKNFIKLTISESLEESAKIDGANYIQVLFRIIFPLMTSAIATMIVFPLSDTGITIFRPCFIFRIGTCGR